MAFQQPSIQNDNRADVQETAPVPSKPSTAPPLPVILDDSQDWVIFQPATGRSHSIATQTEHSPAEPLPIVTVPAESNSNTAGLSRQKYPPHLEPPSEAGSHDIGRHSEQSTRDQEEEADQELDSLDEGLPAFHAHEPQSLLSHNLLASSSVFPRHDGLGTFPVSRSDIDDGYASDDHVSGIASRKRSYNEGQDTDETTRRSSSATQVEEGRRERIARWKTEERRNKIERWRTESSRMLMLEVEKETRKQRQVPTAPKLGDSLEDIFGVAELEQDKKLYAAIGTEQSLNKESVWQRITHRMFKNVMGLEDEMLSVIFGQALLVESAPAGQHPFKAPRIDGPQNYASADSTWQEKLLNRTARELGMFLQQYPRQFHASSTPAPLDPATLPYAGIHVTEPTSSRTHPPRSSAGRRRPSETTDHVIPSISFKPTLPNIPTSSHEALWGIEEEEQYQGTSTPNKDNDYWSSSPTLKDIFQRFLNTRFPNMFNNESPPPSSQTAPQSHPTNSVATNPTPDSLRRAALIRQHHPLTMNNHRRRRSGFARLHSNQGSAVRGHGNNGSSCASENARRNVGSWRAGSGGGSSIVTSMSTSRHYWDFLGDEGSVGGGGWGV